METWAIRRAIASLLLLAAIACCALLSAHVAEPSGPSPIAADAIEFGGGGIYRELFNLDVAAEALANPAIVLPLAGSAAGCLHAAVAPSWPHQVFAEEQADDLLDVILFAGQHLAAPIEHLACGRGNLAAMIAPSVSYQALQIPKR